MKNKELSLIKGVFEQEEAKELLMKIFLDKINFHELKNFESIVRYGTKDEKALLRIPELKNSVEEVMKIVHEATEQQKKLRITAEVHIELID